MRVIKTAITDVMVVAAEPVSDERGFFARAYDRTFMEKLGLPTTVAQTNISFNHTAGTVRGMHYQVAPDYESKLVRCVRGAILDVAVDMREDSNTYLRHVAVELTAENRYALAVPALFAHGFQTLTDDTEVHYQVSGSYSPTSERGLRHDDPALGIHWPLPTTRISEKDRSWVLLR